jgi:predicted RNase H-like nuclease
MYTGIDGFRHGWVVASIDGRGGANLEFICEISRVDLRSYQMAMIDIPIGLPSSGNRTCDLRAKELLGPNGSRVFVGARRPLLGCKSPEEANQVGRGLLVDGEPGAGVSIQLYSLLKKIKEVDDFLNPGRQEQLRESHPELVFLRLNENRPLASKHQPDGRQCRRQLLAPYVFDLNRLIDQRLGIGAKEDDVLDAFACAIAAMDCAERRRFVVPDESGAVDERMLNMQIWY